MHLVLGPRSEYLLAANVHANAPELSPGALVLAFEIFVRLTEPAQHFSGGLEQRLGSRILYLLDVLARMLRGVIKHALDVRCVMSGIILGKFGIAHDSLLMLDRTRIGVATRRVSQKTCKQRAAAPEALERDVSSIGDQAGEGTNGICGRGLIEERGEPRTVLDSSRFSISPQ
jgi:hypothetical protein